MSTLHVVYFSAAGATRIVAELIAAGFGGETVIYDLFQHPQREPAAIGAVDTLLLAMPVYAGVIPHLCVEQVRQFRGEGTSTLPRLSQRGIRSRRLGIPRKVFCPQGPRNFPAGVKGAVWKDSGCDFLHRITFQPSGYARGPFCKNPPA